MIEVLESTLTQLTCFGEKNLIWTYLKVVFALSSFCADQIHLLLKTLILSILSFLIRCISNQQCQVSGISRLLVYSSCLKSQLCYRNNTVCCSDIIIIAKCI